jgi:large subunit ribosomal protein L10
MLTRAQKDDVISGLKKDLGNAKGVFLTNLVGVSSNDAVKIRKDVREKEGKVIVTRNTLFRLAGKDTPYEGLLANLKGTNAIAIAFNESPAVAKVLFDAKEELEPVELHGGVLDGKELSPEEVTVLAKLPSRDQMLATLLATFNAPVSAFVRVMDQIRTQKEDGGSAEPAAE